MDLPVGESYEDICRKFSWQIPEYFNIADAVCDRWADDTTRIAMTHENLDGSVKNFTFAEIKRYSNQFANLLNSLGLEQGDRALVLLTQSPECAISHVACFKSGIVSCLASVLFGPDAIQHRLTSTNAKVCITNKANLSKVQNIRGACPSLEHIVVVDDDSPSHALSLWRSIADQNDTFDNVKTLSEDTAWISFTSGTTGQPKGVLMPHRILLGNKPLFEYYYDYGPREGDTLWSPADWAWIAGLINILLVGWYSGCRVVSTDMEGFNAEAAFRILGQHDITVSLLTPTVLKLMRQIDSEESPELQLRVVLSGGEAVGKELALWADDRFGLTISEGFGQTECNGMIGTNPRLMAVRHGSLGKAMPGSVCAIVDNDGNEVERGVQGNIAIKRPHPAMFSGYLNNPEATEGKFINDWMITGDLGEQDEDGFLWFHGRTDDVITSSGYRIGPTEIEDCLLKSPAVQLAAVIGVPDETRTELIKAFIVVSENTDPTDALAESLKELVRENLAKHEVPRSIEFVDSLPMTTTGKIMRRTLRDQEVAARN
ncbi:MAG: AMP-binding protein [Luminiphilus sp.]|jgi:acetyl-CoA synthetase|nr:AMP-binding protein [Luminiphilus sp.]